jgi:uncharacterized membrane protein YbhN (UPF0104 family)
LQPPEPAPAPPLAIDPAADTAEEAQKEAQAEQELGQVVRGRGLMRKMVLGTFLGVAVFVGFSAYGNAGNVAGQLRAMPLGVLGAALLLALVNYLLRFAKWHDFLGRVGVKVPVWTSFLVFLSGLVMSVTPGKLGELLKAYLLHESNGVPMVRTAPVVIAERLTDLIALLLLTLVGVLAFDHGGLLVIAGSTLTVGAVVVCATPGLAHPLIRLAGRFAPRLEGKLHEAYDSMRELVRPKALAWGTLLSVGAWFAECYAFYLVLSAYPGVGVSVRTATFVYAVTTVAGALSFLPGGLGVTESSMMILLQRLATGTSRATAVAATLIIRLCTLWFAVGVGMVALGLLRRHLGRGRAGAARVSAS